MIFMGAMGPRVTVRMFIDPRRSWGAINQFRFGKSQCGRAGEGEGMDAQ
jgi:hypothetical protein